MLKNQGESGVGRSARKICVLIGALALYGGVISAAIAITLGQIRDHNQVVIFAGPELMIEFTFFLAMTIILLTIAIFMVKCDHEGG